MHLGESIPEVKNRRKIGAIWYTLSGIQRFQIRVLDVDKQEINPTGGTYKYIRRKVCTKELVSKETIHL